jgi:predicted S18 family serine protease
MVSERHHINSELVDINISFIAEQFRQIEERSSNRIMSLADKDAQVTLQIANNLKETLIEYVRTGRLPDSVKELQNTVTDNPDEYFENVAQAADDWARDLGIPTPGVSGDEARKFYEIMAKRQESEK